MSENENIEKKRKRLIFRSEHRGIKEMDLILGSFARKHLADFDEVQLNMYDTIIQNNDPDLYNWILEKEEPDAEIVSDVFDKIKAHRFV